MTEIDSNHRGPIINLATWITLVSMIIFSISKIVTKWTLVRRLHGDDVFIMITTVSHAHRRIQGSKHCSTNPCLVLRGRLLCRSFYTSAVRLGSADEGFERTAIG